MPLGQIFLMMTMVQVPRVVPISITPTATTTDPPTRRSPGSCVNAGARTRVASPTTPTHPAHSSPSRRSPAPHPAAHPHPPTPPHVPPHIHTPPTPPHTPPHIHIPDPTARPAAHPHSPTPPHIPPHIQPTHHPATIRIDRIHAFVR